MKNQTDEKSVDRSRLKLLGVLAAAGASGACIPPSDFTDDTRDGLPRDYVGPESGGEGGGEGSGGGSH